MSIILLTVLVLLVGVVTYLLLKPLVRTVRVIGTCVLMVSLAAWPVAYVTFQSVSKEDHYFLDEILRKQNQDSQQQGKPVFAEVQNIDKAGIIGSGNEPDLKAELVLNTAKAKRSEPATHKGTAKRAELVTHDETVKRAELVRSRHQ
jgi:hypothetical protein